MRKKSDEGVPALILGFEYGAILPNIFHDIDNDSDEEP